MAFTDSLGRKIDFRNTIIIMTSNVGAELIKRQTAMGFGAIAGHDSYEAMRDKILEESKRAFKPEFLNRLDDMIVFHQLQRNDLVKIVDLEVAKVTERIRAKKYQGSPGYDRSRVSDRQGIRSNLRRSTDASCCGEIPAGSVSRGPPAREDQAG